MKSPINEEEMINRFNTYLYILTSSELQDKITFDKSKIQINDYFIKPKLDYISITHNYITSILQLEETKFAITMSDNSIIIFDLKDKGQLIKQKKKNSEKYPLKLYKGYECIYIKYNKGLYKYSWVEKGRIKCIFEEDKKSKMNFHVSTFNDKDYIVKINNGVL